MWLLLEGKCRRLLGCFCYFKNHFLRWEQKELYCPNENIEWIVLWPNEEQVCLEKRLREGGGQTRLSFHWNSHIKFWFSCRNLLQKFCKYSCNAWIETSLRKESLSSKLGKLVINIAQFSKVSIINMGITRWQVITITVVKICYLFIFKISSKIKSLCSHCPNH